MCAITIELASDSATGMIAAARSLMVAPALLFGARRVAGCGASLRRHLLPAGQLALEFLARLVSFESGLNFRGRALGLILRQRRLLRRSA